MEDLAADGSTSPALSSEFRNLVFWRSTKILAEDGEEGEEGDRTRYRDWRGKRERERYSGWVRETLAEKSVHYA